MKSPFPGMDPYLEHPSLWPDVHNLNRRILYALYQRAHFDLRLDYTQPPIPPLAEADAAWARELITAPARGQ
jgi:Protein of unknown function (DUF4058)